MSVSFEGTVLRKSKRDRAFVENIFTAKYCLFSFPVQVFHLLQAYVTDSRHRTNADFQQELSDVIVCTKAKLWLATRYVKAPRDEASSG